MRPFHKHCYHLWTATASVDGVVLSMLCKSPCLLLQILSNMETVLIETLFFIYSLFADSSMHLIKDNFQPLVLNVSKQNLLPRLQLTCCLNLYLPLWVEVYVAQSDMLCLVHMQNT